MPIGSNTCELEHQLTKLRMRASILSLYVHFVSPSVHDEPGTVNNGYIIIRSGIWSVTTCMNIWINFKLLSISPWLLLFVNYHKHMILCLFICVQLRAVFWTLSTKLFFSVDCSMILNGEPQSSENKNLNEANRFQDYIQPRRLQNKQNSQPSHVG
jgi:hypothetical protein